MKKKPDNLKAWIRRLDLLSLRLFASIVEECNVARAAQRESIAASAVTKRMNDLEDAFGYRLLYRDPRGASLTPIGEIVYAYVRQVLAKTDDLHKTLSSFADGVQGHMRVWTTEAALVEYLADDVARFSKAYPGVEFDIEEADTIDILRAIGLGTADIGICTQPDELSSRIRLEPYRRDRLVAVMTRDHPFAQRQSLLFDELLNTDLIGWAESTGLTQMLKRAAQGLGRAFEPKYRVASSQGARSLVRAGLGVAVHPERTVWPYEDAERICSIPLSDAWAFRQLVVVTPVDQIASIAIQTFIDHLLDPNAKSAGTESSAIQSAGPPA